MSVLCRRHLSQFSQDGSVRNTWLEEAESVEPTPLHLSLWPVMAGHLNVRAILGQSGKTEAKSHYRSVSEPCQGLRAPASQLWGLPHCRKPESSLPTPLLSMATPGSNQDIFPLSSCAEQEDAWLPSWSHMQRPMLVPSSWGCVRIK